LKLFYLINEPFEGYQTGYRQAFEALKMEGIVSSIYFYSFYPKEKELGSWEKTLTDIEEKIIGFQPHIILIAHLAKHHKIPQNFISDVDKNFVQKPKWIYDERDAFGFFIKPLSKNTLKFAANCDLVVLANYGTMMDRFKNSGAQFIAYLPQSYDFNFGTEWVPTRTREFDIIMIANRSSSRIPFKSMPGIKEREQIVLKFAKQFGSKFAIFGKGWDNFPCNKGPINFFDQEKILRKSWLSIGMDHFYKYDGYYSDRLPIALVSGVPHITYETPGLEKLFIDKSHLFYYKNTEEALSLAVSLLQKPKNELIEFGREARSYIIDRFSETTRFKKIINLIINNNKQKVS
jgi:hypothetical protein